MRKLYEEWSELQFTNLAEALRRSQAWLKTKTSSDLVEFIQDKELEFAFLQRYPDQNLKPFENPYYWASWSYSGSIN